MAVSADGRFLAAENERRRQALEMGPMGHALDLPRAAGKSWIHFNGKSQRLPGFSADGELLAVAREEEKPPAPIRLFRTADAQLVQTLPGDRAGAMEVAFSRDGKYLASFVQETERSSGILRPANTSPSFPQRSSAPSPSATTGKCLPSQVSGTSRCTDVASKQRERVLSAGHGNCFSLAFSPDGQLLASGFTTASSTFGIPAAGRKNTWSEGTCTSSGVGA